jgi:hypothetical protein
MSHISVTSTPTHKLLNDKVHVTFLGQAYMYQTSKYDSILHTFTAVWGIFRNARHKCSGFIWICTGTEINSLMVKQPPEVYSKIWKHFFLPILVSIMGILLFVKNRSLLVLSFVQTGAEILEPNYCTSLQGKS